MENIGGARLAQMFVDNRSELFGEWIVQQHAIASRRGLVGEAELRNQFGEFASLLVEALNSSGC
jgi:rsbT co-antagonist protein RsbR